MSNAQNAKDLLCLASYVTLLLGSASCSDSPSRASAAYGGGNSGGTYGQGGSGGAQGGSAGSGAQPSGRQSTGSTPLPCEVEQAVRRNCQSCHASRPLSGVPMALVTLEDFRQPAVTNAGLEVHQLANMRIHDTARPMPPPPQVLPATDKTTLELWLAMGGPAGNACGSGGTGSGGTGSGGTGSGGTGAGGTGAGGAGGMPPDQGACYELRAHAPTSKAAPYSVSSEHYVNFFFDAPWPADAQGISFEAVFDEHPEIVHHWLLYTTAGGIQRPDGAVESGSGSHSGAALVAGWAPGGNNGLNLPPDVGLDINGPSRKLVMEIHYYANGSFTSRSGVKVCTAATPRKNLATISWLGTLNISIAPRAQGVASGKCTPSTSQPIHILRSWPHMHRTGRHMKTVINRANGSTETLLDEPFNFNTQLSYDTPAVINPGDTLTTTCTYQNDGASTVRYGAATDNEMCFNYVTAWPANQLKHVPNTGAVANPCMN